MELKIPERLSAVLKFLDRWKYFFLLAAAGPLILTFPVRGQQSASEPVRTAPVSDLPGLEQQMELILSQVEGAGRVRVMLTRRNDGVTTYQTDSQGTGDGSKTVFYSSGSAQQAALICSVSTPDYRGAVIVCEGAENADVRLQLVRAVCSLTGLGSDRVTVLKMKTNQEESP